MKMAKYRNHLSLNTIRTVRARKQIWPGVEISIFGHTFLPENPIGPSTIILANDEIKVLPYKERFF